MTTPTPPGTARKEGPLMLDCKKTPENSVRYRDLVARLREFLERMTTERDQRRDWVPTGDGHHELAWVLHERAGMHAEVNRLRAERGLPPVSAERVAWAEGRACGHHDYVAKYAIGCADLVVTPEG